MPSKKRRISIVISDAIDEQLKLEADKIGISVPTYCAFVLGLYLQSQKKAYEIVSEGVNQAMIVNALDSDEV